MIVLDITDAEKTALAEVLARIAQGINTTQAQKDVAIKVARQLVGSRIVA